MPFRRQFMEPEEMKKMGFDLIKDEDGYLAYQNDGTVQFNTDYNKDFPEGKGKVLINFNTTYSDTHAFLGIKQDAGTRTVYYGVVDNKTFLQWLIAAIR